MNSPRPQRGLTLIELMLFIIVVSIAVTGVLMALTSAVRGSADPVLHKQALAIADALLTEIEQQPFTYCDPDDNQARVANSSADCTGGAAFSQDRNGAALGPVNVPVAVAEGRTSAADPFDNVSDYAGYAANPVSDITGANAMNGYQVNVAITRAGGVAPFAALPAGAVLRIEVTVTSSFETLVLTGYRFRYAPNP